MARHGTFTGLAWDLGTVTITDYDADGFPEVQVQTFAPSDDPSAESMEMHHPFGFLSRPRDPDADGMGCQLFYAREGSRSHGLLSYDPRTIPLLPTLKKGGSVQYGATGSFFEFDGEQGSATCYVPYAFTGATPAHAHLLALDAQTAGAESISLVHGAGMALTMVAGGTNDVALKNKAGDAFVGVNDNGVSLNGDASVVGSLKVGVNYPTPATDLTGPVVLYDAFAVWVTAIQAWITGAIAACAAAPGGPITLPPLPPPPVPSTPTTPGIDSQLLKAV